MHWRGYDKKETKLRFNNIIPVFHSRLMENTNIKCCCNDSLKLHSEVYVFKVCPKKDGKEYFIHAGAGCGRDLIKISNDLNGTNYCNIYFMDPLHIRTENGVIQGFGLRNYDRQNDITRYSEFNKTYLLGIFILCQSWNQPFPYGTLADIIDRIHQNPQVDYNLQLDIFNSIIGKDVKKRTLYDMLESYRERNQNAFVNLNLNILHDYIVNELDTKSRIMN